MVVSAVNSVLTFMATAIIHAVASTVKFPGKFPQGSKSLATLCDRKHEGLALPECFSLADWRRTEELMTPQASQSQHRNFPIDRLHADLSPNLCSTDWIGSRIREYSSIEFSKQPHPQGDGEG